MTDEITIDDIMRINSISGSFNFLKNEPEIYSLSDLKEVYSNKPPREIRCLLK